MSQQWIVSIENEVTDKFPFLIEGERKAVIQKVIELVYAHQYGKRVEDCSEPFEVFDEDESEIITIRFGKKKKHQHWVTLVLVQEHRREKA